MRYAEVVGISDVVINPFEIADFTERAGRGVLVVKQVKKKQIKAIAKRLGLAYDEKQLLFAKQILNEYISEQ